MMMEKVEEFDIVVIGAGLGGIAFARLYLETHPNARLLLLEGEDSAGGRWSKNRNYEHLWVQSSQRTACFSDKPLALAHDVSTYHGMFPARYLTSYIETYIDEHIYSGASLRDRIRFGHYVAEVEKFDGLWHVLTEVGPESREHIFAASRLVIATGQASEPSFCQFLNQDQYKGLLVHQRDFGRIERHLAESKEYEHVAVVGEDRSAADMVYSAVKMGKRVSWIVRKQSEGPGIFLPPGGKDRHLSRVDVQRCSASQMMTISSYMPRHSFPRLFHKTSCGRREIEKRVQEEHRAAKKQAKFEGRPGALPGFKSLNFEGDVWWHTASSSIVQQKDFWSTIAQNVHIYRDDVDHMTSNSLFLASSDTEIKADAILCATGWKTNYFPFLSDELAATLGVPHPSSLDKTSESLLWLRLLATADMKVLHDFPLLAQPPTISSYQACYDDDEKQMTKTRLYRCMAPLPPAGEENGLKARNIIFIGLPHVQGDQYDFQFAEAQAAWATGWFDGAVGCPPVSRARQEIAYASAFSSRRYPTKGMAGDCLADEAHWYMQTLMRDVGLKGRRGRRRSFAWCKLGFGLGKGCCEPITAADFEGIPEEYVKRHLS